ncbi:hypothetical protein BLA15945_07635 [Burkholderia lata]|uniref:Uncharacterized protein n=1 Tax=Burkholderia lata (strain ATCC 17760 / DSM 23089 / LMG 22485 / NCIMB 9086 / R18194 / 383) TaxID=482957 RepID=A0A6P2SR11_BURL3|nr:hypothetical protein BLA15945_07635 [Burkholderia lata]
MRGGGRRRIRLGRRGFQDHVRIGPADAERTDGRAARRAAVRPVGRFRRDAERRVVEFEQRVGRVEVQRARHLAAFERERRLDHARKPRRAVQVPDARLDRAEQARDTCRMLSVGRLQRGHFDRIAEQRAGAVRLDIADRRGVHARVRQRGADHPCLARGARRGVAGLVVAVVVDRGALDDRIHVIAVAARKIEPLQHHRTRAAALDGAARGRVERAAIAVRGKDPAGAVQIARHAVDADRRRAREREFAVALRDRARGHVQRDQRRRARGVQRDRGAGEVQPVGNLRRGLVQHVDLVQTERFDRVAVAEHVVREVLARAHADVDAHVAREPGPGVTGVLERAVAFLHQLALLRIHDLGFARRVAEEGCVETVRITNQPARGNEARIAEQVVRHAERAQPRVVEPGNAVLAREQHPPELLDVVRARNGRAHPDDRDVAAVDRRRARGRTAGADAGTGTGVGRRLAGRGQPAGQRANRRVAEQVIDVDIAAELATKPRLALDQRERVAAGVEEVGVRIDLGEAEHVAPDRRDRGLGIAGRAACGAHGAVVVGGARRVERPVGQLETIDLAAAGHRHRVEHNDPVGHHVRRQRLLRMRLQRAVRQRTRRLHERAEHGARATRTREHRDFGDTRMAAQYRFDFARLDAEAAHLDLLVVAADEFDIAVPIEAGQVAGAIQHAIRVAGRMRVRHEALRAQLGPVQVARRQRAPGEVKLAGHADRQPCEIGREDMRTDVAHRAADQHGAARAAPHGCVDAGLGRAVCVEQRRVPQHARRQLDGRGQQRLAGGDHRAQRARRAGVERLQEQVQHRRHEIDHRHPMLLDRALQVARIVLAVRPRDHDRGALHQRPQHFGKRNVERLRGLPQHTVARGQRISVGQRVEQREDAFLAAQHALRRAGRSGRVENVGRVAGADARRGGQRGRARFRQRRLLDEAHAARAQAGGRGGIADDRHRTRVIHHEAMARFRQRGIERQIHGADPEQREHGLQRRRRAARAHRHDVALPHAQRGERSGVPVALLEQRRIGRFARVVDQRDGVRRGGRARSEALADARANRQPRLRRRPVVEPRERGRQQPRRRGRAGKQPQRFVLGVRDVFRVGAPQAVGPVADDAAQPLVARGDGEIDLHRKAVDRMAVAAREHPHVRVVQLAQHVEAREIEQHLTQLDRAIVLPDLLRRIKAMPENARLDLEHLPHLRDGRRFAVERRAHRHRIQEQPDRALRMLGLGPHVRHHRRQHVAPPAQRLQRAQVGSEQHALERHVCIARERAQRRLQFDGDLDLQIIHTFVRCVARQRRAAQRQRLRAVELAAPEFALGRIGERGLFEFDEIPVAGLHRLVVLPVLLARQARRIEPDEFGGQRGLAPAVEHRVMEAPHQLEALRRQLEHEAAKQRRGGDVERGEPLAVHERGDPGGLRRRVERSEIGDRQRNARRIEHELQRHAEPLHPQRGAQRRMAGRQPVERVREAGFVVRIRDLVADHVVVQARALVAQAVIEHPQLQAAERIRVDDAGRQPRAVRFARQRRPGYDGLGRRGRACATLPLDVLAQRTHALVDEQVLDLEFEPVALRLRLQPDRQQRIAAEIEEAVVEAEPAAAEHVFPQRAQHALRVRQRLGRRVDGRFGGRESRERGPVHLAVRRQRNVRHRVEARRHQMIRQRRPQLRAQAGFVRHVRACARACGPVRDELLVALRRRVDRHDGGLHAAARGQRRLDFRRLDPVAAQLHLPVAPAEVVQRAVMRPVADVAAAVHAGTGFAAIRIGHERGRGQVRPIRIAVRDTEPRDVDVARRASRQRIQVVVEHIHRRALDRHADRHRAPRRQRAAYRVGGCEGRGLGRPVAVDDLAVFQQRAGARHVRQRQHVAAADEVAQLPQCVRRVIDHRREQAARQPQDRHARVDQQRSELVQRRVAPDRHGERRAVQERGPDLERRRVECRRRELEEHVVRRHVEIGRPVREPQDRLLRHDDALRTIGGARRVHQVRRHLRRQPARDERTVARGDLVVVILEDDQVQIAIAQRVGARHHVLARDDHARLAVVEQESQPVRRIAAVERHIRAARVEHRQHRDDQFRARLETQADSRARRHAEIAQVIRQPVRAGVQRVVVERRVAVADRRAARMLPCERVDHRTDRVGQRLPEGPALPAAQRVERRRVAARERAERRVRLRGQRVEVLRIGARQSLDIGGLEQIGAEHRAAAHAVRRQLGEQRQVELRVAVQVVAHRHRRHPGRRRRLGGAGHCALRVLQHEVDLEQRAARGIARDADLLDHLVERHRLMPQRVGDGVALALDQRGERGAALPRGTQREQVRKEADDALAARMHAVRRGRADAEVVLAGVVAQQAPPRGQHHREQRAALPPRQRLGPRAHGGGNREEHQFAVVRAPRRARQRERQFERRRARQPALPVREARRIVRGAARLLPQRIVRIVRPVVEGRLKLAARQPRRVGRPPVGQHQFQRPPVDDQVMGGQHENLPGVADPMQRHAQQRPVRQVERLRDFGGDRPGDFRVGRARRVTMYRQRRIELGVHTLVQAAVALVERRAQRLVPRDHVAQRRPQRRFVERARDLQHMRHVEMADAAADRHLHPHPQLFRRRGQVRRPRLAGDRVAAARATLPAERFEQLATLVFGGIVMRHQTSSPDDENTVSSSSMSSGARRSSSASRLSSRWAFWPSATSTCALNRSSCGAPNSSGGDSSSP